MTDQTALRALVAKWRAEATDAPVEWSADEGHAYRRCAEQLESALAREGTAAEGPAEAHRVTPPRLRGEPARPETCSTHGDPLVCLACEAEEDQRPEWQYGAAHRCSGCGHRWTGDLTGAELCGDCWRKAQPVVHQRPAQGEAESWQSCIVRLRRALSYYADPDEGWAEVEHADAYEASKELVPLKPDEVEADALTPPPVRAEGTALEGASVTTPHGPLCPHGGIVGACSWCDLRDDGGLPDAQGTPPASEPSAGEGAAEMNVPHRFTVSVVLERRALVVRLSGDVEAAQGKGHDSGWSAVRDALEAAGFRVESAAVVSKEPQE